MNSQRFLLELEKIDPSIETIFQQHRQDFDEIIPHVLIADVTRHIVSKYQVSVKEKDTYQIVKIFDFMEKSFELGDSTTRELILLSFLENLPSTGDPRSEIKDLLGKTLSKEFNIVNW